MLTITHSLARTLAPVFRRLTPRRSIVPLVSFESGPNGLIVACTHDDAFVRYCQSNAGPSCRAVMPLDAFAAIAGNDDTPAAIETGDSGDCTVRWTDHGIPQTRRYTVPPNNRQPTIPPIPGQFVPIDAAFLAAMKRALETAATHRSRYALDCLQLDGTRQRIAATDGRQMLIEGPFHFPWNDAPLVSAHKILTDKHWPTFDAVQLGRTDQHVVLKMGPWELGLPIQPEAIFPNLDPIVAEVSEACSLVVADSDAHFLNAALDRLPASADDSYQPLTVELADQVLLRARGADNGSITELVLANSKASNRPETSAGMTFLTDRRLLARAVELGFRQFLVRNAHQPIVAVDGSRRFAWQPLAGDPIAASADAIRIHSNDPRPATTTAMAMAVPTFTPKERKTMKSPAKPIAPIKTTDQINPTHDRTDPIQQAESLRTSLRECLQKTGDLVAALKQHRRKSRIVESTLASLRQLQDAG